MTSMKNNDTPTIEEMQAKIDKLTEMLHQAFTEGYRTPREGMIGLERGWERSGTKMNLETL